MHISETRIRRFHCKMGCGTLIVTKHRGQKYCPACSAKRHHIRKATGKPVPAGLRA